MGHRGYLFSKVELKDYNVMINGSNVFLSASKKWSKDIW